MCLILACWQAHPQHLLVVAANRDEFYRRRAQPLNWWADDSRLLAGRDLGASEPSTWMGLSSTRRFAAVTNVRRPGLARSGARTRGALTVGFLRDDSSPEAFLFRLAQHDNDYNGFNLLVSDLDSLSWHSNDAQVSTPRELEPGVYGLSNAELDSPWPKVRDGVAAFRAALDADTGAPDAPPDDYFAVLADRTRPPDAELPDTGVPRRIERMVSPRFIRSRRYGTRCSTVLRIRHDGTFDMTERTFGRFGARGDVRFTGRLD